MRRRVCEIPIEVGPSTFHSDSIQFDVDSTPVITATKDAIDDVTEHMVAKPIAEAVEKASKEIPGPRSLWKKLEDINFTFQNSVLISFLMDVHVHALKANWDLVVIPARVNSVRDVAVDVATRFARIRPDDIQAVLVRRAMSHELKEVTLRNALDAAGDTRNPITKQLVKIDTGRAKTALGHDVVTDTDGLALDFSPSLSSVEDQAAKRLTDEMPSFSDLPKAERDTLIDSRATEMIANMTQYLYRESANSATSIIKMTGTRYHDEIAAVRALIQKNNGAWEGLSANATNGEIGALIKQLKDRDYVFHHSGKVSLDSEGFPMVEMQLVRNDAHHKMGTGYYEFPDHEIQNWLLQAGDPTRIHTAYENFLGHVGGCKVFTLFYGMTTSYF